MQYGMAFILHSITFLFRIFHSAGRSHARVREVLFSLLSLCHSPGFMPSSCMIASRDSPISSRSF